MKTLLKNSSIATLILIFSVTFISCEGFHEQIVPVKIEVENFDNFLVVNAKIEKDNFAQVQLSYSEDIDASITTPIKFEGGATIVLTNDTGNKETLKYSKDGLYTGQIIKGEVNRTYTMAITVSGKTYTASSTMLPPPGFRDAWVTEVKKSTSKTSKEFVVAYSGAWRVLDNPETRDRYLFEWWRNGWHDIRRDWSIDDNRVVNAGGSLRLFNPTTAPVANEYTVFRAAKIDKLTYDYYNMYEKIVRGIIGVTSQTPYNPVSNFGNGTIGNFRAVAFSSIAVLTPPGLKVTGQSGQTVITFDLNFFFTKYNLYWSTSPNITKTSSVLKGIQYAKGTDPVTKFSTGTYTHKSLSSGTTYYYRVEVEDAAGNVSILSPEASAKL